MIKADGVVLLCLGCCMVVVSATASRHGFDSSVDSESSADSDEHHHRPHDWPTPLPVAPATPPPRIPRVFFHDGDFDDDYVDMDDIFDNEMDTGETMIVLPSNWTSITLQHVNDAVSSCQALWCRGYEACVIADGGDATCQCPTASTCASVDDQPLCAGVRGNARTYSSRCALRVDECAASRLIRVLYRGPCA